jgi:hypothetical protein
VYSDKVSALYVKRSGNEIPNQTVAQSSPARMSAGVR